MLSSTASFLARQVEAETDVGLGVLSVFDP
jgi:hypothetical protein